MAIANQAYVPKVGVGASTPKITNLVIGLAATEFSHVLNSNLRTLIIKARSRAELKIAFEVGESSTKYITISRGAVLTLNDLEFNSKTLYIQSDIAATIEILELHN